MTGWRVGYTVTHPDLVKKLSQITGQATGNICSVSQKAAVAALTGPCPRLLSEAGVALVPGDAFGAPDCIRFSYAVADDVLMDALARVRKVLIGQ